jgi:iron complex outermembrane receptor protein
MCGTLAIVAGGEVLGLPPDAAAQSTSSVEEVVVTARKREESLQDVPVAISAMSGEELERAGVTSLSNMRDVPSLLPLPHNAANATVLFALRGQTTSEVTSTVDTAVGLYLDGVYISRPFGLNGAFFDLERVEVLKGPQGTLYGRNTNGGAISIITRGADFEGVHGYFGADAGNHGMYAVRGAVNIPILSDKLTVRLAAQGFWRDGYVKSRITGQDFQNRNQQVYRATVRFDPSDVFSAVLKAEHYRSDENGNGGSAIYIVPNGGIVSVAAAELFGAVGCTQGFPPAGNCINTANLPAAFAALNAIAAQDRADPFTSDIDTLQLDKNRATTLGLTMTWRLADNVELKSLTANRNVKATQFYDLDGTRFAAHRVGVGIGGLPICNGRPGSFPCASGLVTPPSLVNFFFSQEFNLSGTALSDHLTWLGGLYYSKESSEDTQNALTFAALGVAPTSFRASKVINNSWALFTQNDFKLTDSVSITLGGRYTEEHKGLASEFADFLPATNVFRCRTGVLGTGGTALLTPSQAACRVRNEQTWSGYSYLASLNWKVTPDALLYLRTAKGFRGGAFQLRSPTLAPAGPEDAKDIEAGLKSDWLDHRLRINLAAYQTKYTNKQESIVVPLPGGAITTVLQNAANATLRGFEGEVTAVPTAGLTLKGSVAYIRGKYDRFPGALPIYNSIPRDASGERWSNPPWQYSLSGRYQFAALGGDLALQGDWKWTAGARPGPRLLDPNIPADLADKLVAVLQGGSFANGRNSLGLANARIDYERRDLGLTASVFVTNLFDHRYFYPGVSPTFFGVLAVWPGEPRMWGISLKKTFGSE